MNMIINPEHTKTILKIINNCPYFKLLKMRVSQLDRGHSKVEINLGKIHLNPFGGVHGGVYSSLIDTAAYWAVYCELEENCGLISIDLNINNLAPISEGKLMIEGNRIKIGRTICLAEAKIFNEEGKILSHGTSKMIITKNLQTIIQTLLNTDMTDLKIPQKFI